MIDSHTKVLCTAFKCLQLGFVIFWRKDFGAKAAHKMLVKLTPGGLISDPKVLVKKLVIIMTLTKP
jgi:hypothetical protein